MDKLWFKRKTYGWGWTPASWEGWAIVAAYAASIVFFAHLSRSYVRMIDVVIGFVIPTITFTLLLIVICWAKGEKPAWQWGNKKK